MRRRGVEEAGGPAMEISAMDEMSEVEPNNAVSRTWL